MPRIPSLCGPRSDGRYYATDPDTARPVYFGRDPAAALLRYESWRQMYVARKARGAGPTPRAVTVGLLCDAYLRHAESYYRKGGRPTSECATVRDALRCLEGLAYLPAAALTPRRLKDVRQVMLDKGWARGYVNKQVGRVRRVVRWAVEEELVPAAVWQALLSVAPLKKGRTSAREEQPVSPVAWATVRKTLPFLRPAARDLALLQWWSGMRAEEAVSLRPCDIDRSGLPWVYRVAPHSNKTEHLGRDRRVPLGPHARAVLGRRLAGTPAAEGWLFPSRGRGRRADYRGPVTVNGYRQMVERACELAGVGHWFPLQLRHAALTRIRAKYGLEGAAAVGGHGEVETTQIYAERNAALAARVAEDMG